MGYNQAGVHSVISRRGALFISKVVLCAGFLLMVSCSTTPKRPDWVTKGAEAFPKQRAFYGIGVVSGVKNIPLAFRAADNQARTDISKQVEVYTALMMKQYVASSTALGKISEEPNIEGAAKAFTATSMSGIQIVDRHKETLKEGIPTIYSLAKLDVKKMKENMDQAKELPTDIRDYIWSNAAKLFDELGKTEKKQE